MVHVDGSLVPQIPILPPTQPLSTAAQPAAVIEPSGEASSGSKPTNSEKAREAAPPSKEKSKEKKSKPAENAAAVSGFTEAMVLFRNCL